MKITKKVRAARNIRCSYDVVLKDGDIYRDKDTNDIVEVNSKPIIEKASSPEEASQLVLDFIERADLLGSQYTGGIVLENDRPVYYISYNGRITPFNEFIDKWGTGVIENSRVLKSLGYDVDSLITNCTDVQASSTRDRISNIEQSIRETESKISRMRAEGADEDMIIDYQLMLDELKDELNFAWQDDEAEYNYALAQQEFNPDGSLKGYSDYDITSSTDILSASPELTNYLENLAYEDAQDNELYGTALSSLQEFKQVLEEGEWPVSQLSQNDLKELFSYYLDALANAKQEINSSTNITAARILPNKQIQVGMEWNQDWHRFLVQSISGDRKTCKITEDWLSEDTGEPVHKEYLYNIEDDGEHGEYVWEDEYEKYAKPGQDDYSWWARMYATGADNYPWNEPEVGSEEEVEETKEEEEGYWPTHFILYNTYTGETVGNYETEQQARDAKEEYGMDDWEWHVVETDY